MSTKPVAELRCRVGLLIGHPRRIGKHDVGVVGNEGATARIRTYEHRTTGILERSIARDERRLLHEHDRGEPPTLGYQVRTKITGLGEVVSKRVLDSRHLLLHIIHL